MTEITTTPLKKDDPSEMVPIFGYHLIRNVLLPEILGDETPELLYWAGKTLARKYQLENMDEIIDFFKNAGWGNLTITRERKGEVEFQLINPTMVKSVNSNERHFQLEAGFLAEQLQIQKQAIAEAYEHPIKRSSKVLFTVKWDIKDTN